MCNYKHKLYTLSPLSFCLFFLLSILVNTFTSLRTTKTTFFRHVTCSGSLLHPLVSIRPLSCLHQVVYKCSTTSSSNTSLFPVAALHRRWFFSDRSEILSTHIRSSEITWTSPVRLQHHFIFFPRQTCSHRQQTLQAPVSIKPMVFRHPPRISVHPSPR